MGIRNTLDKRRKVEAPIVVDKMMGTAYETVRSLVEKLPIIEYLEKNIDAFAADTQAAVTAVLAAEQTAIAQAAAALVSQTAAAASEAAARASELAAGTSETNAADSETAAAGSAAVATTKAVEASLSQTAATLSAGQAANSAAAAAADAASALAYRDAAAMSAGQAAAEAGASAAASASAGASAATSTTKAAEAAASAAAALDSQNAAAASQAAAALSESNASDSADAAQANADATAADTLTAQDAATLATAQAAAASASATAAGASAAEADVDAQQAAASSTTSVNAAAASADSASAADGYKTTAIAAAGNALGSADTASAAATSASDSAASALASKNAAEIAAASLVLGVPFGAASLDESGKVPAAQLPSYVDEVIEAANLAAFPAEGESGKIYVALDTNMTWRWSGSAYVEISASPGSTDSVTEGSTNKYFTEGRVRAAVLTGLSTVTNAVITAADSVLSALGKIQKQITDLGTTVSAKLNDAPTDGGFYARWVGSWAALDKSSVGLANVNNTSDANKPVSTAQQAALDAKLPHAGGTLTGDLTLSYASPQMVINAAAAGQLAIFYAKTNGANRWSWGKDSVAEGGANAGSGFYINRYSDAGAWIDAPLSISRSTGAITTTARPTFNGNLAWDAGNFNPASYMPKTGGTFSGRITMQSAGGTPEIQFVRPDGGASAYLRPWSNNGNAGIELVNSAYNAVRFSVDDGGNLWAAGNVTAYSDESNKTDWTPFAADFIERLAKVKHGVYTRIDTGERQVGVGAQSLQKVVPEAVPVDSEGRLSVAYGHAALASTVELAKELVALRARIAELENAA